MPSVLLDTDVILDAFLSREPFVADARELFERIESRELTGYITPVHVANLHYILQKNLGKPKALKSLESLLQLFDVLPMNKQIVMAALRNGFSDFEDALHYEAANYAPITISAIITRNAKDYRTASISVLSPRAFLNR